MNSKNVCSPDDAVEKCVDGADDHGTASVATPSRKAGAARQANDMGSPQPGDGAYLVYEPMDFGTLYLVWSKTPVSNAVGYFEPLKAVPAFKYTHHGGRISLKRKADDKKTYYQGWAEFVKEGVKNYCCQRIHIFARPEESSRHHVQIIMLDRHTNAVRHLYAGKWWDFNPESCQALCIVHPDCEEFEVVTHALSYFSELGRSYGVVFEVDVTSKQVADAKKVIPAKPLKQCSDPLIHKGDGSHDAAVGSNDATPRSGAYLVYKPDNRGTLFLFWAEQPVEDALAYFQPTKTVPKFKYTKGGKYELQRGVDDRRIFLTAWSAFLKEGLDQWGSKGVYFYEPMSATQQVLVVWLERYTSQVYRVRGTSRWWETFPDRIDQVVVVHPDITEFDVSNMAPSLFAQKGAKFGNVFEVRHKVLAAH